MRRNSRRYSVAREGWTCCNTMLLMMKAKLPASKRRRCGAATDDDAVRADLIEAQRDFAHSGLKEALQIPLAALFRRVGEDSPEWVAPRLAVPTAGGWPRETTRYSAYLFPCGLLLFDHRGHIRHQLLRVVGDAALDCPLDAADTLGFARGVIETHGAVAVHTFRFCSGF